VAWLTRWPALAVLAQEAPERLRSEWSCSGRKFRDGSRNGWKPTVTTTPSSPPTPATGSPWEPERTPSQERIDDLRAAVAALTRPPLRTAPDGQPGPPAGREGCAPCGSGARCLQFAFGLCFDGKDWSYRRGVNEQRRTLPPAKASPLAHEGTDPTRPRPSSSSGNCSRPPDVLPSAYVAELASLQDKVPPSPSASLKPCWSRSWGTLRRDR